MAGTELHIHVARQQLDVVVDGAIERSYPVSTVLNGVGERSGSGCTPRGAHRVRAKVGAGCAPGTVFVGRRATGEIYSPALAAQHPGRDWILSRILWLTGCTPGVNWGGAVDTLRRENLFKVFSGIALECNRDEWMPWMRRMGSCPCKQPGRPIARFHSNPAGKCLAGRSAALRCLPIARAIGCAPRLASHPGKALVRPRKDLEQVLTSTSTAVLTGSPWACPPRTAACA